MSWPAASRAGRPGPNRSCARTRGAGCARGTRPGPSPSRSVTPGRKPSISASACSTSRSTRLDPVGVLEVDGRSRAGHARRTRTPLGCVARSTSSHPLDPHDVGTHVGQATCPRTARARCPPSSTTFTPCSGPTHLPSLDDDLRQKLAIPRSLPRECGVRTRAVNRNFWPSVRSPRLRATRSRRRRRHRRRRRSRPR